MLRLHFNSAFKLSPLSVSLFYPYWVKGEKMIETKDFAEGCRNVSSTLDFVVASLGPDMDMLVGQIIEIGTENGTFARARPEHLRIVKESIMSALDNALGEQLDEPVRGCWVTVIERISEALRPVLKPSRRASMQ